MAILDYKSKRNNAKHIFPSFSLILFYFLKGKTKQPIMKCMNVIFVTIKHHMYSWRNKDILWWNIFFIIAYFCCSVIWPSLITSPREIMQNTFSLHFPLFYYYYFFKILFKFLKGIAKTTYHEMHECYVLQILKKKKAKEERSQRILRWSTRTKKDKDD